MATALGSMHEGMEQIAVGVLVVTAMFLRAVHANVGLLVVAQPMQITHGCQDGGRQHGEHQHE